MFLSACVLLFCCPSQIKYETIRIEDTNYQNQNQNKKTQIMSIYHVYIKNTKNHDKNDRNQYNETYLQDAVCRYINTYCQLGVKR